MNEGDVPAPGLLAAIEDHHEEEAEKLASSRVGGVEGMKSIAARMLSHKRVETTAAEKPLPTIDVDVAKRRGRRLHALFNPGTQLFYLTPPMINNV